MPVLNVVKMSGASDLCVVVTRYFGGTLLGTGGLVRAYSGATKAGLEASLVITKKHGQKLTIDTDYTGLGKIQYILGQRGLTILNSIYTDKVALEVLLPEDDIKPVMDEIREGTNGQAVMELKEECYFASVEGNIEIFEN
jgi:putative IMPACT (imprinted ancient) family translation regulator